MSVDSVRDEILAALDVLYPKPLQPGEITIRFVADRLEISEHAAKDVIVKEVKAGRLIEIEQGRLSDKGHKIRAWRKV